MKITLRSGLEGEFIVYCVYWAYARKKVQRIHCIMEYPEDGGCLSAYGEDECDLVDYTVNNYIICKDDDGMDMLIHKAAYTPDKELLRALMHDGLDEDIEVLFQNMKSMGLEP